MWIALWLWATTICIDADITIGGQMGVLVASAPVKKHPTQVRITHIPKTAGVSLESTVRAFRNYTVLSTDGFQDEQCYPVWHDAAAINMVLLRRPRDHIVSMFLECRYRHGLRVGLGRNPYFRAAIERHNDTEEGLLAWLSTFIGGNPHSLPCYDPRNLQTRAMSCSSHGAGASHAFTPNVSLVAALHNLNTVDVVGVTEAFDESVCLLRQRIDGVLPQYCCGIRDGGLHRNQHIASGLSASTLSENAIAHVDTVTALDHELHAVATEMVTRQFSTALKVACT